MTTTSQAKFAVGQLIRHILYGYRGVVIDVDPTFQGSDEWYTKMVSGEPPKDKPWYHVLVHGLVHHAYAAEGQLEADAVLDPIEHPELDYFFSDFKAGTYRSRDLMN